MKYIRTTDERIENRLRFNCFKSHGTRGRYVIKTLEDDNDLELWLKYNRTSVLNQADTIEELCDCFVIKITFATTFNSKKTEYKIYETLDEAKDIVDIFHNNDETTIYAAIWTEWDLKYVAKMNEKGKLELLWR